MSKRTLVRSLTRLASLSAIGAIASCGSPSYDADPRADLDPPPSASDEDAGVDAGGGVSELATPRTYVPKVKNLLTGLAATDEEILAVENDPSALRGLVDQWMALPPFQTRMQDFFRNAFQQNQVTVATLNASLGLTFRGTSESLRLLLRNIMDSFARTAWAFVDADEPFTKTLTTDRYMMTTGLVAATSFVDDYRRGDDGSVTNRLVTRKALTKYVWDMNSKVPRSQSLDPKSPNYMVWRFEATGSRKEPCGSPSYTADLTGDATAARTGYMRLYHFFMGELLCGPGGYTLEPVYETDDWDDWRWVQLVNKPNDPGASPAFFELDKLRAATKLVVHTPRIGFMGTLGFQANWPTNDSNDARVTANQALIVALGRSIVGESRIQSFPLETSDSDHASNPACQGCHSQLDPYRLFFRKSTSLFYSQQVDPPAGTAGLSLEGVTKEGKNLVDLAAIFTEHPRFALAWALKLHFWANSTGAVEDDPEIVRIANAFRDSSFNFKTLVREMMTSPLVTGAAETKTSTSGKVILSIARRDQFCAALSARLKDHLDLPAEQVDICGATTVRRSATQTRVAAAATIVASDGYFRSYELPSLPTDPDLFFRQATEAICRTVADQVVDKNGSSKAYKSAEADAALDDFVTNIMALPPSDERHAPARQILADHFAQAKAVEGATPTTALRSAFVLACLSPTNVIVGL